MLDSSRLGVYSVLEGYKKEDELAYHIVLEKGDVPKIYHNLTHNPKKVDQSVASKHKKIFLLFRGYSEKDKEKLEEFAKKFFKFMFFKPEKPYFDFIVREQNKPKEGKNVSGSKKRS